MKLFLFIAALVLALSWTPALRAQKGIDNATPIRVEADRMESIQEDGSILFSGNVQASQGALVIHADEMTVLYNQGGTTPPSPTGPAVDPAREIESITARGNVKIVQGDWIASGNTMDFDAAAKIVTLAGNAKAWQQQNMVSGEKIVLYLDEGKSVVESSTGEGERVKAFIYPSGDGTKNSGNP